MSAFLSRVLRPGTSKRGEGRAGRHPPDVEVDVAVFWKGEPLLRRRVREGDTASVGDVDGSWVRIPCGPIGVEGFRLARVKHGEAMVLAPRGARGRLERPDGTVELFGSGREVWLLPGDVVRMGIGSFSIAVTGVGVAGPRVGMGKRVRGWVQRFPGGQVGLSAVLHVVVLLVALVWPANEERPSPEQAVALSEAELATMLAVGSEGADEHRSGEVVFGPPAGEAPEWGGEGGDGAGVAASENMPEEAASAPGGDGLLEEAASGPVVKGRTEASTSWGWLAGGALALGGWGALRWRRSRARAAGGRWSWAGALELARRVAGGDRAAVVGVAQEELGAAGAVGGGGASLVVADRVDLVEGSLDVVALASEPDSRDAALEQAWRKVRAGGVLLLAATSGDGRRLAEQVGRGTGAAVVWWFERNAASPGGLQTVVLAVKGRPSRGPRDVIEACADESGGGADARTIARGFQGWGPFEEAAGPELEEGPGAGQRGCFT